MCPPQCSCNRVCERYVNIVYTCEGILSICVLVCIYFVHVYNVDVYFVGRLYTRLGIDPATWISAYFPRPRFGQLTSNISESSNSWILPERATSWLDCAQSIVRKVGVRMREKRDEYRHLQTKHIPCVNCRMENVIKAGKKRVVFALSDNIAEVQRRDGTAAVVQIDKFSCSCRLWSEQQYPRVHACAALLANGQDPKDLISPYYETGRLQKAFASSVIPVDIKQLVHDRTQPPPVTPKRGRPKKIRLRNRSECASEDSPVHCKSCGVAGHNKRTCIRRSAASA